MMQKVWISLGCMMLFVLCLAADLGEAQGYPERFDVVIDVGHGGVDGGTSAHGLLEKDLNLEVGKKLYKRLMEEGYNVGITRIHDYALSNDSRLHIRSRHLRDLAQRKLIAETLHPKLFISLHMNWSNSRRARGPLVIYQASQKSYSLSQLLQQHLNDLYQVEKKPIRGNAYFLMKHLHMPSVIVELGYLSNSRDLSMVADKKFQERVAETLTHAIGEYFLLYPVE
ncbi:N-acetylmuramoyl-L-alanine amidase [Ammoniphilus sp. 3BR4]|uniref:N-acetylmuramoyl-L-alanine amidase family protein n=1 Tax=Ammoniphilus sp. 3BR4 TaxID=3158265 RepID=UPI00346602BF